jgi:hypothetical protein
VCSQAHAKHNKRKRPSTNNQSQSGLIDAASEFGACESGASSAESSSSDSELNLNHGQDESESELLSSSSSAPSSSNSTPAKSRKQSRIDSSSMYSRHPSTWHISNDDWARMEQEKQLEMKRYEQRLLDYDRCLKERMEQWAEVNLGVTLFDTWSDCYERDDALLHVLAVDFELLGRHSTSKAQRKEFEKRLGEVRQEISDTRRAEIQRRIKAELDVHRSDLKIPEEWLQDAHWKLAQALPGAPRSDYLTFRREQKLKPTSFPKPVSNPEGMQEWRNLMLRMCPFSGKLLRTAY